MKITKYSFVGIGGFILFLFSAIPLLIGKSTSQIVIYILGGAGVFAGVFLLLTWFCTKMGLTESKAWFFFLPCTALQIICSFVFGLETLLQFSSVGLLMVAMLMTQELKKTEKPSFLKFIVPLLAANIAPSIFGFVLVYAGIISPEGIYAMLNSVLPISFFLFIISYTFERFVTKKQKQRDDVIYIDKNDYNEK